ncbi:MAG: hypothetical protein E7617_05495 [Ruminococcaceae bacterium]|nr:hypothetical protein [Oscillospiraceae bacterium]
MKRSKRKLFVASLILVMLAFTLLSSCGDRNEDTGKRTEDIEINSFTVGYVPEQLYNNGQFSDADISATAEMDGESAIYMVIDFSYTVVKDIGNGHAISLRVRHSNPQCFGFTVDSAPTSSIEETAENTNTTFKADFSMPAEKGETESVRVVFRIMPVRKGEVGMNIWLTGSYGISLYNNDTILRQTISNPGADISYDLNADGKSYSVVSINKELSEINIPNRHKDGLPITRIRSEAIYSSNLTKLTLGDFISEIEADAFYGSFITKENGISYVDGWAIDCDTELTEAVIRNGTVGIANGTFNECELLESISLPDSLEYAPSKIFGSLKSIKKISVGDANSHFTAIDGHLYNKDCTTLMRYCPVEGKIRFDIPQTVTKIDEYAFSYATNLSYLPLPDGITVISDYAFYLCTALKETDIPNSVTYLGNHAYYRCSSLTNINIGTGVAKIGDYTFANCTSLEHISIPKNITRIDRRAFEYCSKLSWISISKSVTYIGVWAFIGCSALREVYYEGTEQEWYKIVIDSNNEDLVISKFYYNQYID